jgi:hypothetical protein
VSLTTVLAIYGAGLATITATAGLILEWRNRPRLRVWLGYEVQLHHVPGDPSGNFAKAVVEAANPGRTPTSVVEVVLFWDPPDGMGDVLLDPDEEPRVLGPHQRARWTLDVLNVRVHTHVDIPTRARVTDALQRDTWSRPQCILREFVDSGWRPSDTDPALLEDRRDVRVAKPVVPRWQVWRSRHLRRPTFIDPDE